MGLSAPSSTTPAMVFVGGFFSLANNTGTHTTSSQITAQGSAARIANRWEPVKTPPRQRRFRTAAAAMPLPGFFLFLFFIRENIELQRIGVDDFELDAAFGTVDRLAFFHLFVFHVDQRLAFRTMRHRHPRAIMGFAAKRKV